MSTVSIGILGLGRVGTSVGLSLKRYMAKGGKYRFEISGYDIDPDAIKQAEKMGAVDRIERRLSQVVADKDLIVMALSYDEVRDTYRDMAPDLRQGGVVLDLSPLKRPSLEWSKKYFNPEQHVIGMTPILNPAYLFDGDERTGHAQEDLFDASAILITPSVSANKAAVDLAFNFCTILGAKPRFLDPDEHDALLTFTEGLPSLLGVALFYTLMNKPNWGDMQWFTNPSFGVLTRSLYHQHPDAMRDQVLGNKDAMLRAIDELTATLQGLRSVIAAEDKPAIEAVFSGASSEYEKWVNHRFNSDWDTPQAPKVDIGGSVMTSLLGKGIADRLTGKKDTKS